jgi:selT/selW/selH-like putative selenoprotein
LADELRKAFGVESELVPGTNGVFDVIVDGKQVFSKAEIGRFPDSGEIVKKLNL